MINADDIDKRQFCYTCDAFTRDFRELEQINETLCLNCLADVECFYIYNHWQVEKNDFQFVFQQKYVRCLSRLSRFLKLSFPYCEIYSYDIKRGVE